MSIVSITMCLFWEVVSFQVFVLGFLGFVIGGGGVVVDYITVGKVVAVLKLTFGG